MASSSTLLTNSYEAKPIQTDSPCSASAHGTMQQIHAVTPFSAPASSSRVTNESTTKIATLQAKLNRQLGPEFISQRPGPGGGPKLTYAEGWQIINLANEVFGFDGWSTSVVNLTVDFIDLNQESQRFSIGVTAIVRVALREGAFHEDVGYGAIENMKSKAAALDKCKKEAVTDAVKRALRNFGNVLGNCLYDKVYIKEVLKMQVPATKFDRTNLHRKPEFASSNTSRASSATPITSASTLSSKPTISSPLRPDSAVVPQAQPIVTDLNHPHPLQNAQHAPRSAIPPHVRPPPVASPHLSEEKPPVTVARPAPTSSTQLPRGLQTPAQTPRPAQRPQILRPSILPLTKPTASKLAVQQPVAPTIKPAPPQNGVVGASPSSSMHVSDADTKGKLDIEFSTQFFASDDDALYAGVDLNAESYGDDTSTSLDAISMAPPPNPLPPLEPPVLIMDPRKDLGPGPAGGKSAANVSNTAASSTSTHLPVHNAMGGFQVSDQASRAARRISLLNANVFSTDEAATQREEQLVPGKKRSIDDMNSIVVPTNTGTLGGVRRPGKSPLPLLDSEPVVAKRQKT